ncbi:hypothetical protein CsSME_00024815 [Camellia sinensis var. sinensis]
MKKLEIGDGLGSIRYFSLQHFTRSMPWEMDLGFIGELSLVRLRENFGELG